MRRQHFWRTNNFIGTPCSWLLEGWRRTLVDDYGNLMPLPGILVSEMNWLAHTENI